MDVFMNGRSSGEQEQGMTLSIIDGDVTTIEHGIIGHVVNNQRAMGAGVARALYEKWPAVRSEYIAWFGEFTEGFDQGRFPNPNTQLVIIKDDLIVANMCCQDGFGVGIDRINYEELTEALKICEFTARGRELPLYFPYGIGAGLAGGNWNMIKYLIGEHCPEATLVRLSRRD